MTLTFGINRHSYSTYFHVTDHKSFQKMHCFTIFPFKGLWDQISPCHKIGQGQPRVIICTNLMLTWCYIPCFKTTGPEVLEKIFFKFLRCMALAAILTMWPWAVEEIFIHLLPWELYMKLSWNLLSSFRENVLWNVDGPAIQVTQVAKVTEWPSPLAFIDIHEVPTLMS